MHSRVFGCALVALMTVGFFEITSDASSWDPWRPQAGVSESPFVGSWTANLSKSTLHPDFKLQSATLQFSVAADTVTVSSGLVLASGQQQNAAETFRTDGTEVAGTLSPGVTLVAKWVNSHVLETRARKDGQEIGVVTYEVSPDGSILTSKSSGSVMPDQVIVFERNR